MISQTVTQCYEYYLTILNINISISFDAVVSLEHLTWTVWSCESELRVKDMFGGIPNLFSLSRSGSAHRVQFTNASVNTCNNHSPHKQ